MKKLFIPLLAILLCISLIITIEKIPKPHLEHTNKIEFINYISVPETKKTFLVDKLKKQFNNDDIVGRISIPNTSFEQIILQGEDNDYYLNHNIYKEEYEDGAVELDYRVDINDKKIIIYSHNKEDKSLPFSILEKYYDQEFYNNHKYISIEDNEKVNTYEIFSVYVEYKDWDYINTYYHIDNWLEHLNKLKSKSFYDTNIDVNENDSILILQTCSFDQRYYKYEKKNLLVIAKKVN